MTAYRPSFMIPTDWAARPLGRIEGNENCPFPVAAVFSVPEMREFVRGARIEGLSGTLVQERDYAYVNTGRFNIAAGGGWKWFGGDITCILRPARYIAGAVNYFGGGVTAANTQFDDVSSVYTVNQSGGNLTFAPPDLGYGSSGGSIAQNTVIGELSNPFFLASTHRIDNKYTVLADSRGRVVGTGSRSGIALQTVAARQVTEFYVGGYQTIDRPAALSEGVVLMGSVSNEVLAQLVREFYGIFFRPAIERSFIFAGPPSSGSVRPLPAWHDDSPVVLFQ